MEAFTNIHNPINNIQKQNVNDKSSVMNALQSASSKTGVDFSYLVQKAGMESNFNPSAKAKTSSAEGLFQFIDNTWLSMVKKHGAKHGMAKEAELIQQSKNGKFFIPDQKVENAVLDMRNDPKKASTMAAELAKSNENYLKHHIPGYSSQSADDKKTNMYLAHFMGAGGATKFINAMNKNPDQAAASTFKSAARANKNVFFEKNGQEKSLEDVYAFFDKKMNGKQRTVPTETPSNNEQIIEFQNAKADTTQETESNSFNPGGFIMDDGTPLFFSSRQTTSSNTGSSDIFGFTRQVKSQDLFFIQSLFQKWDDLTDFL